MFNELDDPKPLERRSPNYFQFSVTPTVEDNLFMIMRDVSGVHLADNTNNYEEVVEIIFEVSLN